MDTNATEKRWKGNRTEELYYRVILSLFEYFFSPSVGWTVGHHFKKKALKVAASRWKSPESAEERVMESGQATIGSMCPKRRMFYYDTRSLLSRSFARSIARSLASGKVATYE